MPLWDNTQEGVGQNILLWLKRDWFWRLPPMPYPHESFFHQEVTMPHFHLNKGISFCSLSMNPLKTHWIWKSWKWKNPTRKNHYCKTQKIHESKENVYFFRIGIINHLWYSHFLLTMPCLFLHSPSCIIQWVILQGGPKKVYDMI